MDKQTLLDLWSHESKITEKVLNAVPAEQLHFKAHEKSNSIHNLIKTFIADISMAKGFATGQEVSDPFYEVQEFGSLEDGIKQLNTHTEKFLDVLKQVPDSEFNSDITSWGMTKPRSFFVLTILFDHIHHRGQLSVYVRLAGGKVPSIYGPSADSAN